MLRVAEKVDRTDFTTLCGVTRLSLIKEVRRLEEGEGVSHVAT